MGRDFYTLPPGWDGPINSWSEWMRASGMSAETIRLRRGHLRATARRLDTASAFSVSYGDLIAMCANGAWSNDHRRGLRAALNNFYGWAVDTGLTLVNPAEQLPKVSESKPCPRPATDTIWHALLAAADPKVRLMARLAGEAGLRRAEVAQVRVEDLIDDLCGTSLVVHGKGGKQRIVPLTSSLADAIRGHQPQGGFLFPGQIDGHVSPGHVGKLVSALMPAGWSMHKLRHRYASRGLAGTGNLRAVQEALGHASVATTQRYTAVSARDIRAVSEAAA